MEEAIVTEQKGQADVPLGARYLGEGRSSFCVWAPHAQRLELVIVEPEPRRESLQPGEGGYHSGCFEGVFPGTRYFFLLDGKLQRPDPASHFQPTTVHGPSEITDPEFAWTDQSWFGLPLRDYILYELHVGTATAEGTFEAVIPHLSELKDLGITALELMPVAQFPGTRNWGYDGVLPFAVQNSYGGPNGLKHLVNACHEQGLAVVLDVVYNHLGPEGNYLRDFGPYFTDRYHIPWGEALNFDGPYSNEVRRFFIENALQWQSEFHIDALRLDAVHAIKDFSAIPFLQQLARATREQADRLNRRFYLIAESDLNNPRLIRPETLGGFGLDAQWSDDLHHVLHVLLTGERAGYYCDFGGTEQLAKFFEQGYIYTGQYSPSRKCNHGSPPNETSTRQFVVYSQNHDQIGNRLLGERLTHLVGLEKLKLAAGTVLLSPFLPLLFMGEEYGETAPFQYWVSHGDPGLLEAVRQGRRQEFAAFNWHHEMPDPGALATFEQCRLNPGACLDGSEQALLKEFYKELIRLRQTVPAIVRADKASTRAFPFNSQNALAVFYAAPQESLCLLFNFNDEPTRLALDLALGTWSRLLDSADARWGGPGSALPEILHSRGQASLQLGPNAVAVLQAGESPSA
jgi:maltooligosyltrehalose trehalohydrolase